MIFELTFARRASQIGPEQPLSQSLNKTPQNNKRKLDVQNIRSKRAKTAYLRPLEPLDPGECGLRPEHMTKPSKVGGDIDAYMRSRGFVG